MTENGPLLNDKNHILSIINISGKMKGLAFIKDPDGYWIEILSAKMMGDSLHK